MKLSVIIVAYHCEQYLSDCLMSVKALEGDVEIIVVRDVSPVGRARNKGFRRATGDYVWFVDGDDMVAPWTLDVIRPNADIVMFGHERFLDGDSPAFVRREAAVRDYDLDSECEAHKALQLAIDGLIAWSAWYRRDVFKECRFGPYRNCEDTLWGLGCFFKASTLAYVDACPYGYRKRMGSASNRWGLRRFFDTIGAMRGVVSAARHSRHPEWYVRRTLRYALGMIFRTVFPKKKGVA